MAVTYRDVRQTAWSSATASPVVNKPTGVQDGDVMLMFVVTNNAANVAAGPIAGWEKVGAEVDAGSTVDTTTSLWWKLHSGDGSSWTMTNLFDATETGMATVIAYYGVDQTTPVNTNAQAGLSTAGTTVSGPSITPTVDNCMIVQFAGTDPGTGAYAGTADTSPTGTERFDAKEETGGSLAYTFIQEYKQGSKAAIALDATLTSDIYGYHQVAIAPGPFIKNLTEAATLTDTLTAQGSGVTATETATLGHSTLKLLGIILLEAMALTDPTVTASKSSSGVTLTESVGLTDTFSSSGRVNLTETLTLADTRTRDTAKTRTETLTLTDPSVTTTLNGGGGTPIAYRSVAVGDLPSGVQTGDLMIAGAIDNAPTSTPSGWTRIGTEQTPSDYYVSFWYRFRQAGDTFPTFSSAWNSASIVTAFYNVDTSNPIYASSTTEGSGYTSSLVSLTASTSGGDAAHYCILGDAGGTGSTPTDYTEIVDNGNDEYAGYRLNLTASSSTSGTVTHTDGTNRGILHVILKQAGGAAAYTKTLTEGLSLTDTRTRDVGRTISESATLLDTVSKGAGRSLTESAGLSDSLTAGASRTKQLTESVGLTDTVTRKGMFTLVANLSINLSGDPPTAEVYAADFINDPGNYGSFVVSASADGPWGASVRFIKETGYMLTVYVKGTPLTGVGDDAIHAGVIDVLDPSQLVQPYSQTVSLTGSVLKSSAKDPQEALGLTDTLTRQVTSSRDLPETVGLTDNVSTQYTGGPQNYAKELTESTSLAGTVTKGAVRSLSDTVLARQGTSWESNPSYYSVSGNSFTRTAVNGNNGTIYSVGQLNGDCWVEFKASATDKQVGIGLSNDAPTNTNAYYDVDFFLHCGNDAVARVYENGVYKTNLGAYTTSTVFKIKYSWRGQQIQFFKDGALTSISAGSPTAPFYVCGWAFNQNAGCNSIYWGSDERMELVTSRTVADAAGLVDSQEGKQTGRTLTESLTLTDPAVTTGARTKELTESLSLSDTATKTLAAQHTSTEAAALADTVKKDTVKLRTEGGAGSASLGDVGFNYYPAGTSPNTTLTTDSMSTQASGSTMVVGFARVTAITSAPTDNKGNTYVQLGSTEEYSDWNEWATSLWADSSISGGSGHTVSISVDSYGESTLFAVEVKDGGTVEDYAHAQNTSQSPLVSGSVTTTGPAVLVAFWWGNGGAEYSHTAVPNNGFTVLESILASSTLIQGAVAYKVVDAAGTYNVEWTSNDPGGQTWLVAVQGGTGVSSSPKLVDVVTTLKGLSRTYTESATLTGTLTKGPGKSVTEALGLTDSLVKVFSAQKTLTETAGLTDTASKGEGRQLTDGVGLTGSLSKAESRSLLETAGLTSTLSLTQTQKQLSEQLNLSDVKETQHGGNSTKELSDPAQLTDTFSRQVNYQRVLVEAAGLAGSVTKGPGPVRTESVGLTDTILYSAGWAYPDTLTLTAGAIVSGSLVNVWSDDGTELVLSELQAPTNPAFVYDWDFGRDQPVPTTHLTLTVKGWYDGSSGHQVHLYQYNYNTTSWVRVTSDTFDFPGAASEGTYQFTLIDDANYISNGRIRIRISHDAVGLNTHQFHVDEMFLSWLSPSLTETATLSDSIRKDEGRNLTETETLSDVVAKGLGRLRTEAVGLTDSPQKSTSRALTEGVSLADSVTEAATYLKQLTEGSTLTGTLTRGAGKQRAEAATLTATVQKSTGILLGEGVGLSEAIAFGPARVNYEGLGLTETLTKALGRTLAEGLTVADQTVTTQHIPYGGNSYNKELTEAVGLAGTLTKGAGRQLSEVTALLDSLTRQAGFARTLTEGAALVDSLLKGAGKLRSETLSLTESLTIGKAKILTESVGLSDQLTRVLGASRTLLETASLSDVLDTTADTKVLTEAAGISDAIHKGLSRELVETASLSESFNTPKNLLEGVVLTDTFEFGFNRTKNFVQYIPLIDTLELTYGLAGAAPTEELTLEDTRSASTSRVLTETLGVNSTVAAPDGYGVEQWFTFAG